MLDRSTQNILDSGNRLLSPEPEAPKRKFRARKKHISRNKDRDIPYKPLIMKLIKVGISP